MADGVSAVQRLLIRRLLAAPEPVVRRLLRTRRTVVDGVALDPRIEFVMLSAERAGKSFHPKASVVAMRHGYVQMQQLFGFAPARRLDVRDLQIPVVDGTIGVRLYRPASRALRAKVLPLFVYYHGGGFVIGDVASLDHFARFIAARGRVAVLSVDYRLGPEHRFPTAHRDALAAYRWVLANAASLGTDPQRIAVGGDSAGGNLATTVCLQARDAGLAQPAFAWLIYPNVDGAGRYRSRGMYEQGVPLTPATMTWFRERYANSEQDLADPLYSPLRWPNLAGHPPTYLTAAGFDPLVDEGKAYADALQAAGVTVTYDLRPTLSHALVSLAGVVPEARRALEAGVDAVAAPLREERVAHSRAERVPAQREVSDGVTAP